MRKAPVIALLLALLLVSCRSETSVSVDYEAPETWAELFTVFWDKMSSNYIFWSLDYDEGRGWEDVYDEYLPLFEELGEIEENGEASKTAFRYFYEITSPLSDGHYYADMTDGGDLFTSYPSMRRKLLALGYSEDDIFSLFDSWDGEKFSALYGEDGSLSADGDWADYIHSLYECQTYVKEYSLGLDSFGKSSVYSDLSASYLYSESGTVYSIVGTFSDDNIAYFGLQSFLFYPYVESSDRDILRYLETFQSVVARADGVVIDLRGNNGGYLYDLSLLWPSFTGGRDVHFADSRRKDGDNRLDYGVWLSMRVEDDGRKFSSSVPVAVLVNAQSASAAELSVMFFKALRDDYGFNVRIIGETTAGANGALLEDLSEEYYNAGTTTIEPWMTTIYTPFTQVRYKDGTIYEGKGIEPDETIAFDWEEFTSGTDRRLERALEWVRAEMT